MREERETYRATVSGPRLFTQLRQFGVKQAHVRLSRGVTGPRSQTLEAHIWNKMYVLKIYLFSPVNVKKPTEIRKRASFELEVELVSRRTVAGFRDGLITLEVVFGAVVDGVGELVVPVDGAVRFGDAAATVEAPGLVEHHLLGLFLPDLLLTGTLGPGLVLRRVAPVQPVRVDLQDVRGPRDDAQTLVAFHRSGPVVLGKDHVSTESPVAAAPAGNRVEQDGYGVVGDLPRRHGLGEKFALEFQREVTSSSH